MKKVWKHDYVVFLIPLLLTLIGILLYPSLPESIPMQFNFSGESNWSLPKVFGVWTMPVLEVAIILIDKYTKKKSPLIPVLILLSLIQIAIWCFSLR